MHVFIPGKYIDPMGGIEQTLRDLSHITDVTMTILVCTDGMTSPHPEINPHTQVIRVRRLFTLFRTPFSFSYIRHFFVEARKADVIHMHMPHPLSEILLFLYAPFLRKKKVIVTFHSDVVTYRYLHFLYHALMRYVLRRADTIVVSSSLLGETPILEPFKEKVSVVTLGVLDPDKDFVRSYDVPFTFFLFIGRFVYYKGVDVLLRALSGTGLSLVCVGDGPLRGDLEAYAKKEGLSVRFPGFVSDKEKHALYKEASVFVLPSVAPTETFGMVQAEAMAYGLPVINTNLPTGVPWVARDGKEAVTVPPGDVEVLRRALRRLAENPQERKTLGTEAYHRYKENFTLRAMQEKYKTLYLSEKK